MKNKSWGLKGKTSTLEVHGWPVPRPGRFTGWRLTRKPILRKLGGPQGESEAHREY